MVERASLIALLQAASMMIGLVSSERLIWSDEFDSLDESVWIHTVTTFPQEEFQYSRNHRDNTWVEDGVLHVTMTLTADTYGEDFLEDGELDLFEEDPDHPCNQGWGEEQNCYSRSGEDIVKPLQAARMDSEKGFSFKYGRVEVRAKLPLLPWVRPAFWLMPDGAGVYGGWPSSGEIDMMESSGMKDYHCGSTSRGVDTVQTNLHFGPSRDQHWSDGRTFVNSSHNFADSWHLWGMDWKEDYIAFTFDGVESYRLTAPGPPGGLFDMAGFNGENIYREGGPLAPWDQPFHFIISLHAGNWPFYDYCHPPAPWAQNSKQKRREFWAARDDWEQMMKQPYMIDYVRVYQ